MISQHFVTILLMKTSHNHEMKSIWHQQQLHHLCLDTESSSDEKFPKHWFELLHLAAVLHLLRQAARLHDHLVSFVKQLFTELLLHSLSPGGQLWSVLKHIHARSNSLQNTQQTHTTLQLDEIILQLHENEKSKPKFLNLGVKIPRGIAGHAEKVFREQ